MNLGTSMLTGLIAGWLVKWAFDCFFRRRDHELVPNKLAAAKIEVERLKAKTADYGRPRAELAATGGRINQLKAEVEDHVLLEEKLVAAEAEIEQLRIQLAEDEQKLDELAANWRTALKPRPAHRLRARSHKKCYLCRVHSQTRCVHRAIRPANG